ncbi:hypothetical protein Y032_0210g2162 [Ancylostoma ceylanicum]|uniref:Uncharacterized protein n=1 Tax=Ancylostoma ceylanicum TaxID=53326 RepID=A0A016SKL2_9BILA|nr:hypothetical protein Y032_0210g2162 [Ancylostoma ceylanicum]
MAEFREPWMRPGSKRSIRQSFSPGGSLRNQLILMKCSPLRTAAKEITIGKLVTTKKYVNRESRHYRIPWEGRNERKLKIRQKLGLTNVRQPQLLRNWERPQLPETKRKLKRREKLSNSGSITREFLRER